MYKVYRVRKTPLVEGSKGHEHVAEFWNAKEAEKAADLMPLSDDEHVSIEYKPTIEEALNTEYFD